MENKGVKNIILNVVIILVILAVVFLSQQSRFMKFGKDWFQKADAYINFLWQKADNWVWQNAYPKAAQEAQKRGEAVQQAAQQQKDAAAQNIFDKIKNYLAEKFSSLSGTKVK
jgi:predicted PurR-regulated permease PerM